MHAPFNNGKLQNTRPELSRKGCEKTKNIAETVWSRIWKTLNSSGESVLRYLREEAQFVPAGRLITPISNNQYSSLASRSCFSLVYYFGQTGFGKISRPLSPPPPPPPSKMRQLRRGSTRAEARAHATVSIQKAKKYKEWWTHPCSVISRSRSFSAISRVSGRFFFIGLRHRVQWNREGFLFGHLSLTVRQKPDGKSESLRLNHKQLIGHHERTAY